MIKLAHLLIFLYFLQYSLSDISYDHVRIRSYCCYCRSWDLPCPFCTYLTADGCSVTGTALTQWATEVIRVFGTFNPPSKPYLNWDSVKSTSETHWLNADLTYVGFKQVAWRWPCDVTPRDFPDYFGSESNSQCDRFSDEQCSVSSGCSAVSTYSVTSKLSLYEYFCVYNKFNAPGWYWLDKDSPTTHLCNRDSHTSTQAPNLVEFLETNALPPGSGARITQDEDNVYVHTQNRIRTSYIRPFLQASTQINPFYPINAAIHSWCTNSTEVKEKFGDLRWGYWLNLAIIIRPTPCDQYIPYNATYDVCVYDIFAPYGTPPCQDTFAVVSNPTHDTKLIFPIPQRNVSSSCTQCVDYLIDNLPNQTQSFDYKDFAEIQARLASERQAVSHSWWENIIGGVLTAPLFSKFRDVLFEVIDYLLIEFLKIVGDILINFLNTVYSLLKSSQPFIDMLVQYITKILDTLFSLLALILKIAFGLLLHAEQHFLIFEYTCLFLFLNYKFLNNNIFCTIIVIIVAVVFGVERHSPSLLLTFYSPQFDYVNFTYYNFRYFSNKYNITVHDRLNQSSVTYPIRFPSFSDIPLYNTTVNSKPLNITRYPTNTTNVTCNDFPHYNTTPNHTSYYFNQLIHI